ncbi:alpha,alpha-trehalase [Nitritalea halalkaliphila LW7]|uniref:Alpha,alpha-trehalase n=1 Tax=Nitritalea halalkaliphila LW7 TaxID=1189621 RepID=I5C2A4_9BACT|nr:alpha,alpha-trehalase [Nitritalea halalkaliphila LW7]
MPHNYIHFPTSFPGLFEEVQTAAVFPDSKTFVDLIPKVDPTDIMAAYTQERQGVDWCPKSFVSRYFQEEQLPEGLESQEAQPVPHALEAKLHAHWDYLRREGDAARPLSSLLPLPRPYVVPGGRFGEIYYWDSYFTLLGLAESGEKELLADMVHNFGHLIDTVGFIPNGNRSYFLSRSQPPFFCADAGAGGGQIRRQQLVCALLSAVRAGVGLLGAGATGGAGRGALPLPLFGCAADAST